MTRTKVIPKGFVLLARKIDGSEIAHASPCARELFNLFIRRANFKDQQYGDTVIRRGQWLTSYEEIQEALHWRKGYRKILYTKAQIEAAMKMLRSRSMITTTKATRGLFITVTNYDIYQRPDNYGHHSEDHNEHHNNATRQRRRGKNAKNSCPDSGESGRLAHLLLDLIRNRKPDFKEPNLQTWAKAIDLMIRRDNRTPERIEAVIRWCQVDGFWQNNILSGGKLRKQFDQLELRMTGKRDHEQKGPTESQAPQPVEVGPDGLTDRQRALQELEASHAT